MGGRFGSGESELETEARHPVHRRQAPASFVRAQVIALVTLAVLVLGAFVWMIAR